MNTLRKFAVAVLAAVLLSGSSCATFGPKPSSTEEQVPEEIKKIRVMLAQNTQDYQWFVEEDKIDYYATDKFLEIAGEAKRNNKEVNFTRQFPRLSNPPASTVAIAKMVAKDFKKDLDGNGLRVANTPCDSCLSVKLDFAHYEGEVMKILLVIPVWQKSTVLMVRARIFYKGKLVFETSDTKATEALKGLVESMANHEERAVTIAAHHLAKEISALITKTRQQLLAAQQ
ncbi:MAG: hypothetical protein Q8Q17_01900 [bacterium]|nr:hypothetical protein [bacterium]